MLDADANSAVVHAWTPDSKGLIYARRVKRADGEGKENELSWVPLESGAPQSLGIRMPGASAPSLNADGKHILFSTTETSNELWVMRNLPIQ